MKKAALYEEARRRYVEDGQTLAAIGKALQVSPTSLVAWKKDGDWDADRARHRQTTDSIWDLIPQLTLKSAQTVAAELDRGIVDPQKIHAVRALAALLMKPARVEAPMLAPPAAEAETPPSAEELQRLIQQILRTEYGVRA